MGPHLSRIFTLLLWKYKSDLLPTIHVYSWEGHSTKFLKRNVKIVISNVWIFFLGVGWVISNYNQWRILTCGISSKGHLVQQNRLTFGYLGLGHASNISFRFGLGHSCWMAVPARRGTIHLWCPWDGQCWLYMLHCFMLGSCICITCFPNFARTLILNYGFNVHWCSWILCPSPSMGLSGTIMCWVHFMLDPWWHGVGGILTAMALASYLLPDSPTRQNQTPGDGLIWNLW